MLERATGCLKSVGRTLLRGHQDPRAKRMLHSAFWHHGAGDLHLPLYMLPSMLNDASHPLHESVGPVPLPDGFLLDFLYPPKTKIFLRDLASKNGGRLERHHGRQTHLNRYREYSSVTNTELQSANLENGSVLDPSSQNLSTPSISKASQQGPNLDENTTREIAGDKKEHDALKRLHALMMSENRRAYEDGWRLIISADRTSPAYGTILADFLEYLSTSQERIDAERALQLFAKLEKESRRSSSYRAAIAANLILKNVGKAAMIFHDAVQSGAVEDIGHDVLLEQIVQNRLWHLGSDVHDAHCTMANALPRKERSESSNRINATTFPISAALSLVGCIQQRPECFNDISTPALMNFCRDLSLAILNKQFKKLFLDSRQSQQRQVDQILNLVKSLQSLKLTDAEFYQTAIFELNGQRKIKSSEKGNLTVSLYELFRKEKFFSPSEELLKVVMFTLCHHEPRDEILRRFTKVEDIASDWGRFHGYLSNDVVRMMLETFARAGEVALVHKYFGYLDKPTDQDLRQSFFWLIYVHTRRADLNKAIWQFERMTQEFSIQPDHMCYNALLQAYAKNDDLEGALQRYKELESSGVEPDAHTFGILMGMYANRGDPQGVSDLFSTATNHGIRPTPEIWATLVRAHIENDDLATAEEVAEECSQTALVTESTTVIWNQVLTAHALRRDMASIVRIVEQMQHSGISLDSLSYAAIMQCLVLLRQYDAARKILQKVLSKQRVKRLAFHYAILMGGYAGSQQWRRVLGLDAAMRQRRIRHTVSTRIPVLKAQVAIETTFTRMQGLEATRPRLMTTEQALAKVLDNSDRRELGSAIKQPVHGLEGFLAHESYPDAYYEVLISAYGRRGAFDIVNDIFEEYLQAKELPSASSFVPPLRFLTALMQSHWQAREYEDIEKCWLLVYRKAMHQTKVFPVPKPALTATPSKVDASQRLLSPIRMAPSRRHIISRPLALYMRSLSQRREISRAITLVDELTSFGWILSNQAWNVYVQILAQNDEILLAFEVCEHQLIPGWPGWLSGRALRGRPRRNARKAGFDRMAIRTILPQMLLPQYLTMVILAGALLDVQRTSAFSTGGGLSAGQIRRKAPNTVQAIETMPLLKHDRVQRDLLENRS